MENDTKPMSPSYDTLIHRETVDKNVRLTREVQIAKALIISLRDTRNESREDVVKRCADWIESGGEFSDPYIEGQLNYALICTSGFPD